MYQGLPIAKGARVHFENGGLFVEFEGPMPVATQLVLSHQDKELPVQVQRVREGTGAGMLMAPVDAAKLPRWLRELHLETAPAAEFEPEAPTATVALLKPASEAQVVAVTVVKPQPEALVLATPPVKLTPEAPAVTAAPAKSEPEAPVAAAAAVELEPEHESAAPPSATSPASTAEAAPSGSTPSPEVEGKAASKPPSKPKKKPRRR